MSRFILSLVITIVLIATWFVSALVMSITPQMYLDLTAPMWHMALHLIWFLAVLITSMQGVILVYQHNSRRKDPSHYPPYNP